MIIIIFFFFTIVIIIVILENSDGYDGGGKIIKSIWMKKITHLNEQKHISGTGLHHLPGCPVGVSSKVQVKCKGLCKDDGRNTQQSEGVCVASLSSLDCFALLQTPTRCFICRCHIYLSIYLTNNDDNSGVHLPCVF